MLTAVPLQHRFINQRRIIAPAPIIARCFTNCYHITLVTPISNLIMLSGFRDLKTQAHQFLPHGSGKALISLEQRFHPLLSLFTQMIIYVVVEDIFQDICLPGRLLCRCQRFVQRAQDHIPDLTLIEVFFIT